MKTKTSIYNEIFDMCIYRTLKLEHGMDRY